MASIVIPTPITRFAVDARAYRQPCVQIEPESEASDVVADGRRRRLRLQPARKQRRRLSRASAHSTITTRSIHGIILPGVPVARLDVACVPRRWAPIRTILSAKHQRSTLVADSVRNDNPTYVTAGSRIPVSVLKIL